MEPPSTSTHRVSPPPLLFFFSLCYDFLFQCPFFFNDYFGPRLIYHLHSLIARSSLGLSLVAPNLDPSLPLSLSSSPSPSLRLQSFFLLQSYFDKLTLVSNAAAVMSLNGLDSPAVLEAYQTALTEAGGW